MNPQAAIAARINGVWDDPDLIHLGALHPSASMDVARIKRQHLEAQGWTVGDRDPRLNTDYPGAFMAVEERTEAELPTRDGSNGPWCVVGDDLDALIAEAYEVQVGMFEANP
jgi:hypothetical protein